MSSSAPIEPEREGQEPGSSGRPGDPFAARYSRALRTVLVLSWWLWLLDMAWLAVTVEFGSPLAFVSAAGAALFHALLTGGLAGALLALWWALHFEEQTPRAWWTARSRHGAEWLRHVNTARDHRPAASLLAALVVVGALGVVSWWSTRELVLRVARPELLAMVVAAIHLGLYGVARASLPAARTGLSMLLRRATRLRMPTWTLAGALLVVLAIGGVVFATSTWRHLRTLPFGATLRIAVLLALAAGAGALARRVGGRRRMVRRAAWLVVGVSAIAGCVRAVSMAPNDYLGRELVSERSMMGPLGLSVARLVLDRDRDGYLAAFGEGDCAPHDPRANPGAIERPDNGVDEDCDGSDLTFDTDAFVRGRWDFAVKPGLPRRPPVVLLTIDAFAARHFTALGYDRETTPRLGAFAERGVVFEHAFSQGPATRLSMPSLLTGRWDSQLVRRLEGRLPYPIDDENVMLAEIMKDAGYRTAAVISYDLFYPTRWAGLLQGFDTTDFDPAKAWTEEQPHNGETVTDHAIAQLREAGGDPLFLWVHYMDAHPPTLEPPEGGAYGTQPVDLYDAELRFLDHHVGRLLDAIDERYKGQALVIIASDHGIGFDEPRHKKRRYGYDLNTTTLHVPLVFVGPSLPRLRSAELVSTVDLVPTVVNLLRLRDESFAFGGMSLVPALHGEPLPRPPVIYHQMFNQEALWKDEDPLRRVAVRTPQYNMVLNRVSGRIHLWDWQKDYEERHDLARRIGRSDEGRQTIDELRERLSVFLAVTHEGW